MTHDGEAFPPAATPGLQAEALGLLGGLTRDAIIIMGANGCVTAWNAGAEAMLGWTASEAMGRDGAFFHTPKDDGAFKLACEAAVRAGQAEHKRWHRHQDGSLVWGEGCFGPAGAGVPGFVLVMRNETTRQAELKTLQEGLEYFRTLVEGIPQLVWRSGDEGHWTWASPQWLAYTGQTQEEARGLGWMDAVHPADRDSTTLGWEQARAHGEVVVEFRLRRASDNEWRWHQTRSMPVRGAPEPGWPDGRILEWLGTTTDIENLKALQGRQSVLVAELQHRTRNLLAVVSAIARRSFGRTEGSTDFQLRLATLGRVQGFLSRVENWSLDLEELVRAELLAAGNGDSHKARLEGPKVGLPGDKAQPVALALHELATNAAKYGALAQPAAVLSVTWRLEGGTGEGRQLVLDWRESGVAMRPAPLRRRGYGTELIERALPYQLKATTELVFGSDGVRCLLIMPLGPDVTVREL